MTLYLFTMTGSVEPFFFFFAVPLFIISLFLLFFWSFLTCLSSPPSFSVRSDCPAFLAFQLRMLEIPSSCCGLAKSLLLFHPSIPHPSPMYLPVYIWSAPDEDGCGFSVRITFASPLPFAFCLGPYPSEGVRQRHMKVSVEALRQAFIRNSVKRDNTQSNTQD